jgi:ribulose-5-phosphate 4-epimerase/fuculose-1-phosphate aldolase
VFQGSAVQALRADLALALRAAAHHGLGEGVCNHFSVAVPGRPLQPVHPDVAARVAAQTLGEREQSDLFFASLRRMVP